MRYTITIIGFVGAIASIIVAVDVYLLQRDLLTGFVSIPKGVVMVCVVLLVALVAALIRISRYRGSKSNVELVSSDTGSIMRLTDDRALFQESERIQLWLYTAETLLGPCRAVLESLETPLSLKLLVRRPEYDDMKRDVAEGALNTAREIAAINPRIDLDVHFYSTPPLNRLQLFHSSVRSVGLIGVYRHDPTHPMQFIGAERNRMIVLDSQSPEEAVLLSAYESQFNRIWSQSVALRAILFDMDGVLLDSMDIHVTSWNDTLRKQLELPDTRTFREDVYTIEGMSVRDSILWFWRKYANCTPKENLLSQLVAKKRQSHSEHRMAAKPFDGMNKLLYSIRKLDVPLAVVSGSECAVVHSVLEEHFPGIFRVVVSGEDTARGKPTPDPYSTAIERLRIADKNACLVVENAPLGVQSASEAGATVVGLLRNSPLGASALKERGAVKVFAHTDDLERHIKATRFHGHAS